MCIDNNSLAVARMMGGNFYPDIQGTVYFKDVPNGTMVTAIIWGLPLYQHATNNSQPIGPFGFHIHEYGVCMIIDPNNPFESAGGHYNPTNQPHGSEYTLERLIDDKTIVTKHVVNDKDGQA